MIDMKKVGDEVQLAFVVSGAEIVRVANIESVMPHDGSVMLSWDKGWLQLSESESKLLGIEVELPKSEIWISEKDGVSRTERNAPGWTKYEEVRD